MTDHSLKMIFLGGCLPPRAVDGVQLFEGGLGPDAESAHVATGRDLQQVQSVHVDERRARDVTERAADAVVLVIDDQRAAAHDAATVTHFTFACTEAL